MDKPGEQEVLSDVHTFHAYERVPGCRVAISRFEFSTKETKINVSSEKDKSSVKYKLPTTEAEETVVKKVKLAVEKAGDNVQLYIKEKAIEENKADPRSVELGNLTDNVNQTVDDDGDFDGSRKPEDEDDVNDDLCDSESDVEQIADARESTAFVNIKHHLATDLQSVGEQVWLGALLLCDYILENHQDFSGQAVVDLGAGTGLSSIVAGLYANRVFCTDTGEAVLQLAQENVQNARLYHTLPEALCPVDVRELDWFKGLQVCEQGTSVYSLTSEDAKAIQAAPVLLAADVVYDDNITDAFFKTIRSLLQHPPNKTLYIGLEKRLVFTIKDLDVTSAAYQHFRRRLDGLMIWGQDLDINIRVKQIPTNFRQYFQYTRTRQLELWKVWTSRDVT